MADLSEIQAAQAVKIIGSDNTGLETTPVRSFNNGDLSVSDILSSTGSQSAINVTTTSIEAKVGASKLTNRKSLTITPINGNIYWGYTNSVTIASGTPLLKNQTAIFAISDTATVFLIASSTVDTRITEGS